MDLEEQIEEMQHMRLNQYVTNIFLFVLFNISFGDVTLHFQHPSLQD